jgi:hypothetical protein
MADKENYMLVYLVIQDGRVIPGADLESLKEATGVSGPDMTVTDTEWYAAGSLARVIDGKIVLGRTDAEKRTEKEAEVRTKRDEILLETVDRVNGLWWEAMTGEQKKAWRAYRRALLDIPEQAGYPFEVAWPETPQ